MEVTPSGFSAGVAAVGLVGGGLVRWLVDRDKDQEERFNEKLRLQRDAHDKLESQLNARLASSKEEKKDLDRRLAAIERDYISRVDHAEFKAELMGAVKDIGAQVSHSLDGFRGSMEKLVERINRVEHEASSR